MHARHWLSTSVFTCFVFTVMAVLPLAARAQPADDTMNQAKMHFEAGKNAYNAGDYQNAIKEFKAAEALRPSPILDYNIALANEKLAKKRVAVKYYKRYLEGMPNATNRAQVEATVAQLEREIAAQPAQPEPTQTDLPPTQPPPGNQPTYGAYDPYGNQGGQPPVVAPQPPPKKKSYWWVALIVVGGVLLISIPIIYYAVVATGSVRATGNNALDFAGLPPTSVELKPHTAAPTLHTLFSF
jgi:tetratricopeptide (TPR) repeat protein